jgi:transposase-like protein
MMKQKNFGEWVRIQVTKEGKTMAWMAREVGASQSLLSRWRQGAIPRTEYFLKVCCVLATLQARPICGIVQEGALVMGIKIDVNT